MRSDNPSRLVPAYTSILAIVFVGVASPIRAQYEPETTRTHSRVLQVAPANEPSVFPRGSAPNDANTSASSSREELPSLAQHRKSLGDGDAPAIPENSIAGPAVTVTSSLAVVLGLFALMIWCTRKFGKKTLGHGSLPNEVLQSLGTATLDARTKINLLRCGGRVIVVAQSATGIYPISEFTSPEEVRQLIASCQSTSKQTFAQTLRSFEQEPASRGFVGQAAPPADAPAGGRKRGRLFTTA